MAEKKYVGSEAFIRLVAQIKAGFASLTHTHKLEDITDYKVDAALSSTSANPVQNKAIKAEFQAVQDELDSLAEQLGTTDLSGLETKSDAAAKLTEAKSYTDSEVAKVTSGTIVVKEAEHADSATTATTATNANHAITADSATSATTATSATKATRDGNGNVIASTYETKADADATEAALTKLINSKADSSHTHSISNVTNLQSSLDAKVPISRTVNGKALSSNISLTASDVGADTSGTAQTKADAALASAKSYTDQEIADLINSAPTTLDTLGEIATAMQENEDVVEALEDAIGTKADASALTSHTSNKSNPHGVTATQVGAYTKTDTDWLLSKKMDDFSLELYNGTSGNPKPVRFASFNYSTCGSEEGIAAKISMVSGHGNGSSYAFLQDAIIKVSYLGQVEVDNFKYYGQSVSDGGVMRQYGDIFWLIDEDNKIVDFYVLMGQYARLNQTPWKRLTYSSKGTVTQHTSCTVYSSGEKNWANNAEIATKSDIPEGQDLSVYAKKTDIPTDFYSKSYVDEALSKKADTSSLTSHTGNSDIHVTAAQKTNWNSAYTHSQAAHAPSNAEKNQNAFSNVTVGSTTIAADSATDTLTLVAGSNVTLTPDSTNDSVTIAAKDTVYTHPSYTSKSNGLYKISVDGTGHVSGTAAVAKSDITALGIPAQDTTYSDATTSTSGLMSSGDKTKLNGVATGAEVNQNAFSNVTIGSTTISADAKTDTLTLVAGSNVTLTPDATNDKITIAAKDTTYSSLKNPYSLTIQGNGTTLTNGTYDGSAAKTVNITPSAIGAAASSHTHDNRYYTESEINSKLSGKSDTSHTHKYAGSSRAGGSATSAVKLDGGAYIVASASAPTNANAMIWIKTTS